ncbi:hypothetical protein [Ectobacillus polymachus]|uniref:hypothetical protein n=1 Tax=Ectobacillus polymachus TaxID=1508806 RepID=UPI003A84709E
MNENEKKLVLFPNLADRLRDKGFDALHAKQFEEALPFLNQLLMYDLHDEHSEFAAVVCLIELHEWKEAKVRCKDLLDASDELKTDVEDLFITILVQLHDFNAVVKEVERLLEEDTISEERQKKLSALYAFAQKMLQEETQLPDEPEYKKVFEGKDVVKQIRALEQLRERGTIQAFSFLRSFLQQEDQHPYIKSMIIHMMMEFEVDEEVVVVKYGRSVTVKPKELLSERESPFSIEVLRQVENRMGQDNPTMLQAVEEYWHQMLAILFPLIPTPEDECLWAAALQKIGEERFFMHCDDDKIAQEYGVTLDACLRAYEMLISMEKDGYLDV